MTGIAPFRQHRLVRLLLSSVLTLLTCLVPVGGVTAAQGFDVVTMKNGDIYNGSVIQPTFTLETDYGVISLRYGLMASLQIGRHGNPDRMTTRYGDRFSGSLGDDMLTIDRVGEAVLEVNTDDIDRVSFHSKPGRRSLKAVPDAIEMANGDLFLGRLGDQDLILKTESSLSMVMRADSYLIDIASTEERDSTRVQIELNQDPPSYLSGRLLAQRLMVTTRYGHRLKIPLEKIERLALNVNYNGKRAAPLANYQSRHVVESRFRDRMRDGTSGPELSVIRGGSYHRGNPQGVGDFDEQPLQQVTVRPFAIGTYEVTFDLYDLYCIETRCPSPDDQGWGRGRRPVINVSWNDAKAFTRWLSGKTGQRYRLPTDAEWEYAARAGTRTTYWWGDELQQKRANCDGCDALWSGEMTARVGRFPANPFGIHDTAGNVFEWVEDCWNDTFAVTPADGSAYRVPACVLHVIRGGAWSFPPHEVRSANRWRDFATRRSDDTGFRVVRELTLN